MKNESGSALVGIGLALAIVTFAIAMLDGASVFHAQAMAANAADSAALAAAPVTFRPFGAIGSPASEAARFARANGSELVSCVCPIDRSNQPRQVEVVVARDVELLLFGRRRVTAASRAQFAPGLPNLPQGAERIACSYMEMSCG